MSQISESRTYAGYCADRSGSKRPGNATFGLLGAAGGRNRRQRPGIPYQVRKALPAQPGAYRLKGHEQSHMRYHHRRPLAVGVDHAADADESAIASEEDSTAGVAEEGRRTDHPEHLIGDWLVL